MIKPSRILITGVAGFIGSHLAEALAARGSTVIGIDSMDPFYDVNLKRMNLEAIKRGAGTRFQFNQVDICDSMAVMDVFRRYRPRAVVHLAALAGVRPSIERPAAYARVNVEGTANVLEAAVATECERFVFASSSSVYGNNARIPFHEDDDVSEPISPYAATKRSGELLCHAFWRLYGMPIACLRFFTVFGPRQRPDLAIRKFVRLIESGLSVPMFGDGSSSRDYTFVADIVQGICRALERTREFRIYNLGNRTPVSLIELILAIQDAVGKPARIDYLPQQPGDVSRTFADISRAAKELGYHPRTSLTEGLQQFVDWSRLQKSVEADRK
jgi:UDP-glucuronate 4-epimerase